MVVRIAVIADVHGNLPALKAVLDDIKGHAVDQTVCLGDLAFKGPAPGQCVRMIQDLGIPCIYGNTDLALLHVAGRSSAPPLPDGYTVHPDEIPYLEWHLERMTNADLEFLALLPFDDWSEADGQSIHFFHASPLDCHTAIRPSQPLATVTDHLRRSHADWMVMGHIHEPFLFRLGHQLLVNAGAVGFSLDGNWRPSYAVLDTASGTVLHQRVH